MWDRHDHDALLRHPDRQALYDLAQQEPGISYTQLLERLAGTTGRPNVANGSLSHHLYRLERGGLLTSRRSGRFRRYYPRTGPWHADLEGFSFVGQGLVRDVAVLLCNRPGRTLNEIAAAVASQQAEQPTYVRRRLRAMVRAGLLETTWRNRAIVYWPSTRLRQVVGALARTSQPDRAIA